MQLLSSTSQVLTQAEKAIALYDPRGISGLILWLDANSLNSILSNGDLVNSWTDKSSYGNVAVSSGANRPIFDTNKWNGNSWVRFDGSTKYMSIARVDTLEPNNITIIAAYVNFGALSGYTKLICRPYRNSGWTSPYISYSAACSSATADAPLITFATGAAYTDFAAGAPYQSKGLPTVFMFTYDGTTGEIFLNGVSRTTTTARSGNIDYTNQTDLFIGMRGSYSTGDYFNGGLSEIFLYNSCISSSDKTKLWNYFTVKYGINTTSS
jgi:hypothetical protein